MEIKKSTIILLVIILVVVFSIFFISQGGSDVGSVANVPAQIGGGGCGR